MKSQNKLIAASKGLKNDAEKLNYDLHLNYLPWGDQKLSCDLYFNNIKRRLLKIDKLIPDVQPKMKRHKAEHSLKKLAAQIFAEAHRLNDALASPPEAEDYDLHCRFHYNNLLARVKQFEELYKEISIKKESEPKAENPLLKEIVPDEKIFAEAKKVRAQHYKILSLKKE